MIWNNLSARSDYDFMQILEGIQSNSVEYDIDDLKNIQYELIKRHMDKQYMSMINERLKIVLQSNEQQKVELKVREKVAVGAPTNVHSTARVLLEQTRPREIIQMHASTNGAVSDLRQNTGIYYSGSSRGGVKMDTKSSNSTSSKPNTSGGMYYNSRNYSDSDTTNAKPLSSFSKYRAPGSNVGMADNTKTEGYEGITKTYDYTAGVTGKHAGSATTAVVTPAEAVSNRTATYNEQPKVTQVNKDTITKTEFSNITPRRAPKATTINTPANTGKSEYNSTMFSIDVDDSEHTNYGALKFLAVIYRIFAWVTAIACVGGFAAFALLIAQGNIIMLSAGVGATIILGTILIVSFYAASESVSWKIDVVNKLRKLVDSNK